MERYQVQYGGRIIEFALQRKNVKNVNLHIKPDMNIIVSASKNVPMEFILRFVEGKASWILKNVSYFRETQPVVQNKKREYVSGESFQYLGKQYRLRVIEDKHEVVKYLRGFIYLYVKDTSDWKRKESLYNQWLRNRAELIFKQSLEKVFPLVQKYDIEKPEIVIGSMKARWGVMPPIVKTQFRKK